MRSAIVRVWPTIWCRRWKPARCGRITDCKRDGRAEAAKSPRLTGILWELAADKGAVMPPILLSPLVKWSFVALSGAMVVHWVVKEARRINDELEAAKRVKVRI